MIVRKICHKLSVNGSALLVQIVTRVGRFCEFGTIPLPKKLLVVLHNIVPVLHVIPVLAANLSWRNGQPMFQRARRGFLQTVEKGWASLLGLTRSYLYNSMNRCGRQNETSPELDRGLFVLIPRIVTKVGR